jgi:hypothetical protein
MLAAFFASRLLCSDVLKPAERVRYMRKLIPIAVASRTALDTVLSRLILALRPQDRAFTVRIEDALRRYALPEFAAQAGPEPVA